MKIQKFKNGNFAVRREPKYDSEIDNEGFGRTKNLLFDLLNSAELDFVLAGEEGCAGNYDVFYPLYNYNTGLIYSIYGEDCRRYADGEHVHIYGRKPDESEIEKLIEDEILDAEIERKFSVYQLDMWADGEGGWMQNDQFHLGEISVTGSGNLKGNMLRAMDDQLGLEFDESKVYLDDSFSYDGRYEITAKKRDEPLVCLQEVS